MLAHLLLAALAQTPPPAPTSDWTNPAILLTLGGALIAVIGWSVIQDRRIERAAKQAEVDKSLAAARAEIAEEIAAIREAIVDMGKLVAAAQSRDTCAVNRQKDGEAVASLERRVTAKLAAGDQKIAVIMERLTRIDSGQDEIIGMLNTLFEAGGLTPRGKRAPIKRQATSPLPPPVDDENGEG